MDTKALADIFLAGVDKIEFYWNFYMIMILALTGWLVSTEKAFKKDLKILLSVGYLLFAAMNILGLWGSYRLTEALRLDLLAAAQADSALLKNSIAVLSDNSFAKRGYSAILIHLVFGGAVLAAVWRRPESDQMKLQSNNQLKADE